MTAPYSESVKHAQMALGIAIQEAKCLLPGAVLKQHYVAAKHSPAAWASVEHWYVGQPESDTAILRILCDLKLMVEARACLQSVTTEQDVRSPPDLRLAKRKRVEL